MLTLNELTRHLDEQNITYELIAHPKPILTKMDAKGIFDIDKAVPVFILKTEACLVAFIMSPKRERIDFKLVKNALGSSKLSFADEKEVFSATGYKIGNIPLIGHGLPYIIDSQLLDIDFIYGGTGDAYHTLKIAPGHIVKVGKDVKIISY